MSQKMRNVGWNTFHYLMLGLAVLIATGPFIILGQSWSAAQAEVDHYRLEGMDKRLDANATGIEGLHTAISDLDKRLAIMELEIKSLGTDTLWHQITPFGVASLIAKEAYIAIKKRKPQLNDDDEESQ